MMKHPPWLSLELRLRADAAYGNYKLVPDQRGGLINHVWTEYGVSPQQIGGLLPNVWSEVGVYPQQQGDGLGAVLRGAWRFFKPILAQSAPLAKSALKAVGKQALASAGGLMGDLVSGANLANAAEYRFREGVDALGEKAAAQLAQMGQAGSGYRRKRKNKRKGGRRSPYSLRSGRKVKGRVSKRRVSRKRRAKPKKQVKRRGQKRKRSQSQRRSKRIRRTVQSGGELLF
jgi:hypothetical protein